MIWNSDRLALPLYTTRANSKEQTLISLYRSQNPNHGSCNHSDNNRISEKFPGHLFFTPISAIACFLFHSDVELITERERILRPQEHLTTNSLVS